MQKSQECNFSIETKIFCQKNAVYLIPEYKTYISPELNYCSPVWSPSTACDILLLKSVQNFFTKNLSVYQDLSYKERLCKSGIKSFELTRLYTDLILCHKILHSLLADDTRHLLD